MYVLCTSVPCLAGVAKGGLNTHPISQIRPPPQQLKNQVRITLTRLSGDEHRAVGKCLV